MMPLLIVGEQLNISLCVSVCACVCWHFVNFLERTTHADEGEGYRKWWPDAENGNNKVCLESALHFTPCGYLCILINIVKVH